MVSYLFEFWIVDFWVGDHFEKRLVWSEDLQRIGTNFIDGLFANADFSLWRNLAAKILKVFVLKDRLIFIWMVILCFENLDFIILDDLEKIGSIVCQLVRIWLFNGNYVFFLVVLNQNIIIKLLLTTRLSFLSQQLIFFRIKNLDFSEAHVFDINAKCFLSFENLLLE